ncbi:adhesion G protein-coupled receptor L4-like isoform X3 [Montipora capricornis]|uniref:adhesion G protein-coupled receptor L4-like isoform X3 n=1 Tax=Montipora capricornis TaxID=246305 RepID=UPI0035F1313C
MFHPSWAVIFLGIFLALQNAAKVQKGQGCSSSPLDYKKLWKGNCEQLVNGTYNNHRTVICFTYRDHYAVKNCLYWRCYRIAECFDQSPKWRRSFCSQFYWFRSTGFDINATKQVEGGTCVRNIQVRHCDKTYPTWWSVQYIIFSIKTTGDWCHSEPQTNNGGDDHDKESKNEMEDYDLIIAMRIALSALNVQSNNSLKEAVAIFGDKINDYINYTSATVQESNRSVTLQEKMENVLMATVVFEEFALQFADFHLSNSSAAVYLTSDKVDLQVKRAGSENKSDFYLEETKETNYIKMPSTDFQNGSVLLGVLYKDLHEMFTTSSTEEDPTNNTSKNLNTIIMSVTMRPQPASLQENVTLGFKNVQPTTRRRECVFWNFFSEIGWSNQGCHVTYMDDSVTECSCNHLTHFAVLVQFDASSAGNKDSLITKTDEDILIVITRVGLVLSLIGITLTIICYVFFADIKTPLSQIRVSLVSSLGAGQIIFFAGIGATESRGGCVAVAAMIQYFLMAAFCWMLIEGIYLYLFVVKVYNVSNKMILCHGVSWSIPALMVILTLSIAAGKDGMDSFVSERYCWMSSSSGLIWIFVSFFVFIEVVNVAILARVIKEMTSIEQVKDNNAEQLRLGIRACVVLIPLLGVTWLFGLLSSTHKAFVYIFTILNTTQGFFIFLLHCVRNTEIRERLKRRLRVLAPLIFTDGKTRTFKRSSKVNESRDLSLRKIKIAPRSTTNKSPENLTEIC